MSNVHHVTASTRPSLYDALAAAKISGVSIAASGSPRADTINDLLQQAHALTILIGAAMEDQATIEARNSSESSFGTTRSDLKAIAMNGLGTLIGLAAALSAEG